MNGRLLLATDEICLEVEPAVVGPHLGSHGLIGHRQDRRGNVDRSLEVSSDVGRPLARGQSSRPDDVGRQVTIAEAEPRLLAQPAELVHGRPRLVADAPAALAVVEPGERVHDGVVIRPDRQPVALEVVARVDDDG